MRAQHFKKEVGYLSMCVGKFASSAQDCKDETVFFPYTKVRVKIKLTEMMVS